MSPASHRLLSRAHRSATGRRFESCFGNAPAERALDESNARILAIRQRWHVGLGRGGCAADRDSSLEPAEIPAGAMGGHGVPVGCPAKKRAAGTARAIAFARLANVYSAPIRRGPSRSAI